MGFWYAELLKYFGKGKQELRNKFREQMGRYNFQGDWILGNRGYQHFYTHGFKLYDEVVFGQYCNVLAHIGMVRLLESLVITHDIRSLRSPINILMLLNRISEVTYWHCGIVDETVS